MLWCSAGVALLGACAGPAFTPSGGLLWDRARQVGVPDLTREGWQRDSIRGADLAFRKRDRGWIAVRMRCPAPGDELPLRWESRELWLGIPRDALERRSLQIDGRSAVQMSARSGDLVLRTAVVRAGECSLDAAQSAPAQSADAGASFERFLAGIRLRGAAS